MHATVVLSTYNAPQLLERVLWGYSIQDTDAFDIAIADDGSTEETARLIERMRDKTGLTIEHVWHEDRGFRKCEILNEAIAATSAEYMIFSDGDCIPRSDFVSTHLGLAQPGRFLSGGYLKLSREASEAITVEDVLADRATDPEFLLGKFRNPRVVRLKAVRSPNTARLFDFVTPTKATWNGHNASAWRSDVEAANGFDERMKYGGEDREFGERLVNAGIRPRQVRHRAIVVHLWHERGYVRQDEIRANRAIRRETARTSARHTPHGIVKEKPVEP